MDNSSRVLIVEDERLIARALERQLQGLGYSVVALVSTGEEAIHQAFENRPHIVLMDIRLRGQMDGIEAVATIRKHLNVKIVYERLYRQRNSVTRPRYTAGCLPTQTLY
jgi:CheY-like chemotaxis protein